MLLLKQAAFLTGQWKTFSGFYVGRWIAFIGKSWLAVYFKYDGDPVQTRGVWAHILVCMSSVSRLSLSADSVFGFSRSAATSTQGGKVGLGWGQQGGWPGSIYVQTDTTSSRLKLPTFLASGDMHRWGLSYCTSDCYEFWHHFFNFKASITICILPAQH